MSSDVTLHKQTIQQGSKSFAMASFFFSEEEKEAAWKLYSWCRYCDDEIDNALSVEDSQQRLKVLFDKTSNLGATNNDPNFQFAGMNDIVQKYQIPMKYPLDLLRGMEMDVTGRTYHTLEELEDYCYCVASTVGLMMCHILGIRSDEALSHAVAMGKAMQLTNICRDIKEDWERGRCYLPVEWISERRLEVNDLYLSQNRTHLLEIQERLLKRADELYEEGYGGLKFLSLRSSWAVLIAAKIYSYIGVLIRKNPELSLEKRIYVSKMKKLMIVFSTITYFLKELYFVSSRGEVRQPQKIWSIEWAK